MFGKFTFECDPEYFDDAVHAAKSIMESDQPTMMAATKYSDGSEVHMFVRRLKRSVSVKQVKP